MTIQSIDHIGKVLRNVKELSAFISDNDLNEIEAILSDIQRRIPRFQEKPHSDLPRSN